MAGASRSVQWRTDDSPYAGLIVLTGARAPVFTSGEQNGDIYSLTGPRDGRVTDRFRVDMVTSRALRYEHGGWHPDIQFTNVQSLPQARASTLVQAALARP